MKLSILSRKAAEELIEGAFPENTAVISFYDPPSKRTPKDYAPVDYKGKCKRLLAVGAHDIDIEILPDYGLTFESYLPEAGAIANFVLSAIDDGLDMICQCEYGQSRSSACAAAILQHFEKRGIDIFADYRYYPNQLVYHKIFDALERCAE